MRRNLYRRLERVLWVAGLAGIGWAGVGWADGWWFQARAERQLDRAVARFEVTERPAVGQVPPAIGEGRAAGAGAEAATAASLGSPPAQAGRTRLPAGEERTARPGPGEGKPTPAGGESALLGRLEIPRLGLSVVVAEGDDRRTLRRAAGHLPETPLPGQPGNAVIAGHRDLHFRPLESVRVGDEVLFTTPAGSQRYRVDWVDVTAPSAVEVLAPTPVPALTLVTCYPFTWVGTAPDRFVVRAVLVGS
ncbi:MAG TPA: class D sortase [Thermoanaerobaculia bacterium]|nr:class D sortase [Thermoanaerobaculia bacterium]